MDDGPQHIEIELTEHAGTRSRGWRRRGGQADESAADSVRTVPSGAVNRSSTSPSTDRASDVAVTQGPEPAPPVGSDRGRLVATGLAAGVVALVIGWTLGRAGDDGSAQTVDATSTTDRTATTVGDTILPGEVPPAASLPASTRPVGPTGSRPPRTTTTTLPPVWVESTITVDPRLAGVTDRIVAISADRELIELDLATGALRMLDIRRSQRSLTPLPPVAGDDWVAVQFDDGRSPIIFRGDDAEPTELMIDGDPWSLQWDIRNGSVWQVRFEARSGWPEALEESQIGGTRTGRAIDVNGLWPNMSDPAGGVVVGDGSGIFTARPDGSQRIGDGRLLALGMSHVLSWACGDSLDDCGLRLIDRESGEWRAVPHQMTDPSELQGWWGPPPPTAMVTPDGGAALLVATSDTGEPTLIVLDTVTGQVHDLRPSGRGAAVFPYPSAVWSNDGRWAFTVDGTVVAYDRTTGDTFPVADALPRVSSVTVRPPG